MLLHFYYYYYYSSVCRGSEGSLSRKDPVQTISRSVYLRVVRGKLTAVSFWEDEHGLPFAAFQGDFLVTFCVCVWGGLIKTNDKHRHKTFINYRFQKLYDNLENASAVFVCSFSLKD